MVNAPPADAQAETTRPLLSRVTNRELRRPDPRRFDLPGTVIRLLVTRIGPRGFDPTYGAAARITGGPPIRPHAPRARQAGPTRWRDRRAKKSSAPPAVVDRRKPRGLPRLRGSGPWSPRGRGAGLVRWLLSPTIKPLCRSPTAHPNRPAGGSQSQCPSESVASPGRGARTAAPEIVRP